MKRRLPLLILAVLALAALLWGSRWALGGQVLDGRAMGRATAAAAAALWLAWLARRRGAQVRDALTVLAGLFLAVYAAARLANQALDFHEARVVVAPVLSTERTLDSHQIFVWHEHRGYFLRVQLEADAEAAALIVDRPTLEAARPGMPAEVLVKPGAFGWRWIKSVRLPRPGEPL